MGERNGPFRKDELKHRYWPLKFWSDSLISALGFASIGFSGFSEDGLNRCGANSNVDNCESVTNFNYVCMAISALFLTFPLVRNTELAWSIFEAVWHDDGYVSFLTETSTLPSTVFSIMWSNVAVPSYFARVVVAVFNVVRFVLILPFEILINPSSTKQWLRVKFWVCFAPSMLIIVIQYTLLYVLLQQTESVLDALFATVSLQVFAELSQQFVSVVFDRNRSIGELVEHYSVRVNGLPKIVAFITDQLCLFKEVEIDVKSSMFQKFFQRRNMAELFNILGDCLVLYRRQNSESVTIKFSGRNLGVFSQADTLTCASELLKKMNTFKDPRLELNDEDYRNLTNPDFVNDSGVDLGSITLVLGKKPGTEKPRRGTSLSGSSRERSSFDGLRTAVSALPV